ncbi:zinc-dependent peptidase [Polaromonas sp.]|uniref:M90 family metallopeptidase n=1 Tax=Polaromonas sp. TaxID=1869339 RepID=UPI00286BE0BE|nr:zinc-dependent peptidase [Polaromonas sp.]
MPNWFHTLLQRSGRRPDTISQPLWQATLAHYPFLARRPPAELAQLRLLASRFLAQKEFSGAHGLEVTDAMAVAIAAQACLPVLHLGLKLYDDFKGIVVHPGAMLARRETTDAAGVVHRYSEVLAGEAMQGGPVTLSWQDVAASGGRAERGYNVVIHEFVHKIDMRDGSANGCPPLPGRAAYAAWRAVMLPAYEAFCEQVAMAQRFGGEPPWLDAYAATAPAEFFAVTSEAYFMNRPRFAQDFAPLAELFDAFFEPKRPPVQ